MVGMSLLQPNNWRKAYVVFAPCLRMHLFASFGWWLGNMQDFMPDAVLCDVSPSASSQCMKTTTC
jgi:hypothetical protein